jgi:hypothetical protein
MEEALRIANTVKQEELQDSRSDVFYLETGKRRTTPPTGPADWPRNLAMPVDWKVFEV